MNESVIKITYSDYIRLSNFVNKMPNDNKCALTLRTKLERVKLVEKADLPQNLVSINTHVRFRSIATNLSESYMLTFPDNPISTDEQISVLSPIGAALFGSESGDEITWETPGGIHRAKIEDVMVPQEDSHPIPSRTA